MTDLTSVRGIGPALAAQIRELGIDSAEALVASEDLQQTPSEIRAILAEGGMGPGDVAHVSGYVTDRAHMQAYMAARDAFLHGTERLPSSTLLIVSGFTRPEFKVEVEVLAAAP